MRSEIFIKGRRIAKDEPVFIMAECGVTCNYDLDITKKLIDTVADSGADAIKFIFWFPDELMSDREVQWTYQTTKGEKTENMYEMLGKLRFSLEEWKEVKRYADSKNVIVFATVNSPSGIRYTEEIGLEAYKLSSWDFNDHPLWREVAKKGKPMLIDTGPVDTLDVAKVVTLMNEEGNDQAIFVHCFHTRVPSEMNMRALPYMEKAFQTLVGYSSADFYDETDIMAVTLGAVMLEKRLTMSRDLPGHHHIISKEPEEFKEYVKMIRGVQNALGVEDLRPSPNDLKERRKWFKRVVANKNISAGTVLTHDMLMGKRPEMGGVSPEYLDLFVGHALKRDLQENEPIQWSDI